MCVSRCSLCVEGCTPFVECCTPFVECCTPFVEGCTHCVEGCVFFVGYTTFLFMNYIEATPDNAKNFINGKTLKVAMKQNNGR